MHATKCLLAWVVALSAIKLSHQQGQCPSSVSGKFSGSFSSPSYPNNYPNNKICRWVITVPRGYRVKVQFHTFETQSRHDYLEIYDGPNTLLAYLDGTLNIAQRVHYSTGSSLGFKFSTDGSETRKGFHATYTSVTGQCPSSVSGKFSGSFSSPFYPINYLNNMICKWGITVPRGYRVKVQFHTFETESGYDSLKIYDGDSTSSALLAHLSGTLNVAQRVHYSTGSSLWFSFSTDGSATRKGFHATYTSVTGPYSSYLDYPRLTFSGHFRADTPTLNNFVPNYDFDSLDGGDDNQGNWNPTGSGEWGIYANVTSVCYKNGSCVSEEDKPDDPVVGSNVIDGGIKTPGKMAALDVQVETFACEIWGWSVQVGDLFSGAFKTTGAQYLWRKVSNGNNDDPYLGAVYQSILTDITWINSKKSPFATRLREITEEGSGALSIKFNLDIINEEDGANRGVGRIVGTIGVSGDQAPPFVTKSRMLKAEVDYVQDAPFKYDDVTKRLTIDFGNSLPISSDGEYAADQMGLLLVGWTPLQGISAQDACSSNRLVYMGNVSYAEKNWYLTTAGIQVYDLLPHSWASQIKSRPLIVVKVAGTSPYSCKEVVLAEDVSGLLVSPYSDWIQRVEPGNNATFAFMVTKFGALSSESDIELQECKCPHVFEHKLKVGVPNLTVPLDLKTDKKGVANLQIATVDPGNIRDPHIDGQLYGYLYCIPGTCPNQTALCNEQNRFKLMKHLIVFRVFSRYILHGNATWYKDVYPIFKQYSVLFPVMKNFLDLGNYRDVVYNKEDIKSTLRKPKEEPNHMPVNRDMSATKRDMLLGWLSEDRPSQGSQNYTLENLRKNLQTAIELEHSTIPTYLTALASIKPGYNRKVYYFIKTIVGQEMLHLALAANVLNAVGGKPKLHYKNFIPNYPSAIPGGVQPHLTVPIEKCSIGLIRNVFMAIEQPEVTVEKHAPYKFRKQVFTCSEEVVKYCEKYNTYETTLPMKTASVDPDGCTGERPIIPPVMRHHSTIGGFYNHILCYLVVLSCPQGRNQSIFTGNVSKQLDHKGYFGNGKFGHGSLFKVTNLTTALKAITEIVKEGEGCSPCNPISWAKGNSTDLSHYFLFSSIVEGSTVEVCSVPNKTLTDKMCSATTYKYTGPSIPFDPDGVWPMIPNPKMFKYASDSKAHAQAIMFNKVYTKLLLALDQAFNGQPDKLGDAISVMHNLIIHLNRLMRTPVDDNGDPDVGPNAGPTFDFTP